MKNFIKPKMKRTDIGAAPLHFLRRAGKDIRLRRTDRNRNPLKHGFPVCDCFHTVPYSTHAVCTDAASGAGTVFSAAPDSVTGGSRYPCRSPPLTTYSHRSTANSRQTAIAGQCSSSLLRLIRTRRRLRSSCLISYFAISFKPFSTSRLPIRPVRPARQRPQEPQEHRPHQACSGRGISSGAGHCPYCPYRRWGQPSRSSAGTGPPASGSVSPFHPWQNPPWTCYSPA